MIADESIEIIERTVKHLKNEDSEYDKHPAIVAGPGWWLDKIKSAAGKADTDVEIESLAGCAVTRRDDLQAPVLIAADGRVWNLLPNWLRAPAAAA